MKSALAIATLSLSLCLPAQAYEVQTGTILVCDTPSQVQRFADLFNGNVQVAIGAVNFEEKDPAACAMINASFVEGPSLDMARSRSHAFRVVPIVVIGINTARGYGPVNPAVFFTLVEVKEFAA
jgi:hypothetical protein